MENEIEKLRILVDVVAKKIEGEVKADDTKGLKEMLWQVPTNILAEYATREE